MHITGQLRSIQLCRDGLISPSSEPIFAREESRFWKRDIGGPTVQRRAWIRNQTKHSWNSHWSFWMSIDMQFGVDFLCPQMPIQHQQTVRQKSHSWKCHKNAPVRCPYSNSPITWSHRNQCNWSPWKKDVGERQSIVVGVALWTFVHITRAGSIHRAEQ